MQCRPSLYIVVMVLHGLWPACAYPLSLAPTDQFLSGHHQDNLNPPVGCFLLLGYFVLLDCLASSFKTTNLLYLTELCVLSSSLQWRFLVQRYPAPQKNYLLGHPMASWDLHLSCRSCLHKMGLFCTRLTPCAVCSSWSPSQWKL